MPTTIIVAEQSDGTLVPMCVGGGQMIKVTGHVKGKFIAEDVDSKTFERYNMSELVKFVEGLGYSESNIKGTHGKMKTVGKDDIIKFLVRHWAEWFGDADDEDDKKDIQ